MPNKKQPKTNKESPKKDQPKKSLEKSEPKNEPKIDNKAVFPMKDFTEKEEFKEEVEETIEKKYFLIRREVILSLIFLFLLVGLAGGGYFVYHNSFQQKNKEDASKIFSSPGLAIDESKEATSSLEAVIATQSAEASESAGLKQKDLFVKVLNGNGQKGSAGRAKEYLENLGYEEVQTGNAGVYDYEKTEIEIKESKEKYLQMLENDLSDEYELATSSAKLDETNAFDAVVIIGGE